MSNFTITATGEGTNVAGYPRTISQAKTYTREQIIEFLVADQSYLIEGNAHALISAMSDEELAGELVWIGEIEIDIFDGEMLSNTSFDVEVS